MFTRVTSNGGRSYLQIMESYRNDECKPRVRVVANLGRIDTMKDGQLDALIRGLSRAAGRPEPGKLEITYEDAKGFGDVFALHELWRDLGFDRAIGRGLRSGRRQIHVEALVRAMVFNRMCDPTSKLGCLRWLDTVAMPDMPAKVEHHHLLRAMDALLDNVDRVEAELAKQIRPLVDQELTVVFHDLTTVRIHGEGEVEEDIRAYGMNKETGGIARQFVLGDWQAVWREAEADTTGTVIAGPATALDCHDTLLHATSETQQLVGIGLKNIIAVAMPDAVLVAHKDRAQEFKQAVATLKAKSVPQAETLPRDYRPWGWYESLVVGPRFQVKRIVVHPGAALSLQSHHHRAVHWVVVEGTAKVTVDAEVKLIAENQSVYIPLGAVHRMENPGKVPLTLIEVQTGSYLGEDDIIRYEDVYAHGQGAKG